MSKHLITYGHIANWREPLHEVGLAEYLKKRLQFWKWRLHHTRGRPVLMLRTPTTPAPPEVER